MSDHSVAAPITLYELAGRDPGLRISPYCWRTRFALAHKSLSVDALPWRFTEKAQLPSPEGRVPVIIDGGKITADSWAIAEYLDATYPNRPSLFGDARGRAHARFYNAWADDVLLRGLAPMVILDIWRCLSPEDQAYFRLTREKRLGKTLEEVQELRETRVAPFRAVLEPLRIVLKAQPWLGGESPSYADYIIAAGFQFLRCVTRFDPLEPEDPVALWRGRAFDLYNGLAREAPLA